MKQQLLTTEDVAYLCRSLAQLSQAGISPGDGLTLLAQEDDRQALLTSLAHGCDEGRPLSALFREAGCFPDYVCGLLAVGDRVGQTAEVLEALADYYENRSAINRRLRDSLTYPALLLTVLLGVAAILFIWVLPVFDDVYAQLGSGLTGFAGGMLAFGAFLRAVLPWICGLVGAMLLLAAVPPVRKVLLSRLAAYFRSRGVGAKINAARYIQALSLGISSGLTDREAAELAAALTEEPVLPLLDSGLSLPQALLQSRLITPRDCRLLETGRRSGHPEAALGSLSRRMGEAAQEALERAMGRIEPAITVLACGLIGGVLLSVMLPLVRIMNAIG